jgi:hypothetical protein
MDVTSEQPFPQAVTDTQMPFQNAEAGLRVKLFSSFPPPARWREYA